jgi:CRISPR-associated protein Cmr5
MSIQTKSQLMAKAAFEAVKNATFDGFVREFPTLVHSCGLAQAFVYAKTKKQMRYREALTKVLKAANCCSTEDHNYFETEILKMPVPQYIRLSRDALLAAVWIKRYAEADSAQEAKPNA